MIRWLILPLLLGSFLAAPQPAGASGNFIFMYGDSPVHLIVLMPGSIASVYSHDSSKFDGAEFPLYCGIISIYPKQDKFVFTKTTPLPIPWFEEKARALEREKCIFLEIHGLKSRPVVRVPVADPEFSDALAWWADNAMVALFKVSGGEEIPVNVVPRFTRTCPFNSEKHPATDCAFSLEGVRELYIPFTAEEMKQIAKDHAR